MKKPRARTFLSPGQVRAIFTDPRKQRVIAAEYGVGVHAVGNIKARRTHHHQTTGLVAARNPAGRPKRGN
jgi:hypothetical protein